MKMQIEQMQIGKIKPFEKNPRRNDDSVDAVANSIKAFGFRAPIIVDRDLVIIAGHTRLKAAEKLGLKEVPVIVADDMTEEQAKAYRLADRLRAAEDLHRRGIDTQLRLSPLVPEYIDLNKVIDSPVPKVLVEFLRINPFIEKALPYLDTSEWTLRAGGYRHLPLERKKEIIRPLIAMGKKISVCEDVPEHYEYWREHVNHNPADCCNLRRRV